MVVPFPWGHRVGPLALPQPLHELPRGNRKNFPKFKGDGKVHPDEHIAAFIVACGVLGVEHEDVFVRLFVETLQDNAADWFYHLPAGAITSWDTMRTRFENHFKPAEDVHALLAQISQIKKDSQEPMREFVARFNRLINKIPPNTRPVDQIQKCFFLNAQSPEVSYALRRANLSTLVEDQTLAISVEDDLIMSGKLRRDPSKSKSASSSSSTPNTDPLVQKLANDLIAIKKQLAQHAPYADVPRKNFQPRNHFPASQTRLALEGPPIKVPVNATCEVEEPDDEEDNEDCEEFVEEVDDEADELEGSRVNFFTTEGIDDGDDYDEVVADMNSESYAVMTRE
ncbi:hypothetical protein KI387_044278 [Taxus chinensis]|uniref:Retrotransposon gag domain-containing protein n=1 Tax=Taxus chinensis TaxID=29808 RepID=A0AA38CD63_TAXCH|nr:hypothetical protein KI387_044278 [Taxus chinensis]